VVSLPLPLEDVTVGSSLQFDQSTFGSHEGRESLEEAVAKLSDGNHSHTTELPHSFLSLVSVSFFTLTSVLP
jgi:hypothetical protein